MKFVMSDGRQFTDYQPNCSMNINLRKKLSPGAGNNDFRYHLQKNADAIMKQLSQSEIETIHKNCPVCTKSLDYHPNK